MIIAPADAMIMKANPEQTADVLAQARDKIRSYGIVESGDAQGGRIGAMTDARWADTFKTASGLGLFPADMDYKRAYSLQFIPAPQ
jgi:NitT/TauT family transport system substrate-binding protein